MVVLETRIGLLRRTTSTLSVCWSGHFTHNIAVLNGTTQHHWA
jgi:hypothetical protein